jgi:hypothetical protein
MTGCATLGPEILRAVRDGLPPPPEVVPADELRGKSFRIFSIKIDGRNRPVWRIRCVECAWFDHQWSRVDLNASYAEHRMTHGAAA